MAQAFRVVAVTAPVLRRVIRAHRGLGLGTPVPHTHCYALAAAELAALADETDLPPETGAAPPGAQPRDAGAAPPGAQPRDAGAAPPGAQPRDAEARVLLVASDQSEEPLGKWRLAYHAAVHATLDAKRAAGLLHRATLRERIHRIGQTEFDEVRAVLRRDEVLLSRSDDEVYAELAASFFELSRFEPAALDATFPSLTEREGVLAVLRLDVDDDALLAATRPDDAPETPSRRQEREGPPAASPPRPELRGLADEAARAGRLARAAILEAQAEPTRAGPHLLALAAAIPGASSEPERIAERLIPLARAATGFRSLAGRTLYDLERAVRDGDRPVRALRFGRFFLGLVRPASRAKGAWSPIFRLPCAEEARVVRHLSRAEKRARRVLVSPSEKEHLLDALEHLHASALARLEAAVRPRLFAAFEAVGLVARCEREVPFARKLVSELVERVSSRGFFTFGELRDAVSRNRIKVQRLSGPSELFGGDPLLRLDDRLAHELDGLYRPGEIYLRALEKLSSLAFGTGPGAFVTQYLALPLLLSFVVLEGLSHIVGPLLHKLAHVELHLLTPASFVGLAAVAFGLLHVPRFRAGVLSVLGAVAHAVGVVLRAPFALLALPLVERLRRSAAVRFGVRPLVVAVASYGLAPRLGVPPLVALVLAGLAFVLLLLLAATRAGRRLEDALGAGAARVARAIGRNLLPGLFALVSGLFGGLLEGSERIIHAVDEWLRLRGGDSRFGLWAKGGLALVWGLLTYVVRLYLNVLVEPQVNPIKHFPVVTVSHKLILPLTPTLLEAFRAPLLPLGALVASSIAGPTVFLLPGAFGFLVWELKENWKLYSENQPRLLGPAAVGSHGETIRNLLVPGFHAGTIPKLYAKWRRAALRKRPIERLRAELHHVEEAVGAFVARELLAVAEVLVGLDGARVERVHLASNRIVVHVTRAEAAAELVFEEQSGRVLGSFTEATKSSGVLAGLDQARRARLENIVAGFYRLAAVDLVREQLAAALPSGLSYDVEERGLAVFREGEPWEAVYPLSGAGASEAVGDAPMAAGLPVLELGEVVFGATEITLASWQRALDGEGVRLPRGSSLLSGLR